MVGINTDQEKLNCTLEKVCSILHKNHINDWFIMFGTLLGIVRENICIEGDDDLDLMISIGSFGNVRTILLDEGFKLQIDNSHILKTEPCDRYGSIDFYISTVEGKNYFTPWQNVEIQNVEIENKEWRSTYINLPKNPEDILEKLYGSTWRTTIKYTVQDKLSQAKKGGFYNQKIKTII